MRSPASSFGANVRRQPNVTGALGLFLVLCAIYPFSAGLRATQGSSITGDEPFYLMTTQSLVQDGDLDLRQQYLSRSYEEYFDHRDPLWKQAIPQSDGKLISPHEPGLSVLIIPGFVAGGLAGVQAELLVITAAAFALAFVLVARETRRPRLAWPVTLAVAITAPAFVYATEVYPEVPAAFCLVAALLLLPRRRTESGARRDVFLGLTMCAALSALAWLGMKYIPLGVVVAVAFLWQASWRGRIVFLGLSAMSAVFYAWFHLEVFGALTAYNSNAVYNGAATSDVLASHVSFADRFYRLWGLFIDRRFGIGRWAPILLAVLPLLPLLVRGGLIPRVVLALVGVQLAMATFVAVTMMGWWFPGRMLIVVYPLFPLVLAFGAIRFGPKLQMAGALAGLYSALVTFELVRAESRGDLTVAFDPFTLASPLFSRLGPFFPQYTSWTTETNLLNAAWVAAGVIALAFVCRAEFLQSRTVRAARTRRTSSPLATAPQEST